VTPTLIPAPPRSQNTVSRKLIWVGAIPPLDIRN